MGERQGRRRALQWIGACLLIVFGVPAGWMVSDAVERNNDFCNACHLPSDVPLHERIRQDFDGRPPMNLAARHSQIVRDSAVPADPMRCIDCHGGVGLVGRAEVKLLAARDAIVYLTGDFEEPQKMSHPLKDQDCRQCHDRFDQTSLEFERPRFHELGVHNTGIGIDCVSCHLSHEPGDPSYHFIDAPTVRGRCSNCHSEFAN